MAQEEILVFAIRLAVFAISLMAGALCLLQRRLSNVYGVAFLMFMVFMTGQLIYIAEAFWPNLPARLHHLIHMASYVAGFLYVPAFMFHLFSILRPNEKTGWKEVAAHLAFPGLVFALACWSMFVPIDVLVALKTGLPAPSAEPWMEFAVDALIAIDFGVYVQVLIYVALVYRLQRRNRERLETVFSSDKRNETVWIVGVACAMILYLVQAAAFFFWMDGQSAHAISTIEESCAVLFFVIVVAVRGLRQAPGLHGTRPSFSNARREGVAKYSKSALADEHAERIAKKLHLSMSEERLYTNPNLSLTKLAKHVGSSPNYVSQTLNEHMQQSFFDFVNQWRIKEAEQLLLSSDTTILDVAYEVGFNSRSAFYTAFKKHNGMTPTQFRNKATPQNSRKLQSGGLSCAVS